MAGQDAELQLKVSLDLAFFRQQLSTIGAQLGGQSLQLNVQFNKKSIADQYRLLDRYVRGRKFNVELNLVGGLTKNEFEKIKGRLDDLRALRKVEIPIGIKNGATGKDVDQTIASIKARLAQNQQIKQGGGKLRIETSVKPSVTNEDIAVFKKAVKDKLSKIGALEIPTKLDVPKVEGLLKALQKNINRQKPLLVKTSIKPSILSADVKAFKKAVESKLSGITVKINAELETIGGGKTKAQIEKEVLAGLERIQQMGAERMGGGVTEPARRESLRQSLQGRDIGELKDIGKQLGVAGVGKFRNTQNLIERIVTEASIEMITKYLDPQAVMRNPDRSGLNKVLDTFARGLFNMLGMDVASMRQQAAQRRALPSVNFPATVPSRPVSIGPSSTGRALPAGAGPAGMIGAAQAPAGLLPSITARSSIKSGVEALFAAGGPQFPMAPSGKLALSTEALQARVDKILTDYFKIAEVTVKEIFNPQDLKRALNIFSYLPQALRDAESRTRQARIGVTSAQGIAGLLPAAAGRAPSTYSTGAIGGESREQMMARRTAEAYARSALRGMDVMGGGAGRTPSPYSYAYRSARPTSAITPYAGPGAIVPVPTAAGGGVPPTPPAGGGGGGFGGFGGFGRALGGLNLPGSNAIRELGSEFAFATKQVLLFGQAYKLLGFLQDFPGQVMSAVSSLQSFRNTLNTVSTSANEAASSNQLILDLASRFNVPLQSMRDGFTKLYASMQPAGFSGEQIRGLFTGVSKAAATFGMSADKVDRVNYAFAQMASKGQVMSEELKGQLGDVLPGAMALFAQAAGFKGPKAIQDFSVALEDGRYKGEAMVALLNNVSLVMNEKFGPGAEGAAKTLQGAINNMQNSMTLLYESFEPVAVGFLNSIVTPLSSGIKTLTDGFNAFFNSTAAKTAGGFAIAQELERLKPAFEGIRANAGQVIQTLGQLARIGLEIGKIFLQIAGNPLVGYLAKLYAIAMPINMMLGVMRGLWIANSVQLLLFNARVASGTSVLSAFRAMMATTGATASVTAGTIRTAGLTLRTFFAATGVGLVVAGISVLIERFMAMNQALADTKDKALGAAQAIRAMSSTEARRESQVAEADVKVLQRLLARPNKGQGAVAISQQEKEALGRAGVRTGRMVLPGQLAKPGTAPELIGYGQQAVDITQVRSGLLQRQSIAAEAEKRIKDIQFQEKEGQKPMALAPIPATAGEEGTGKGKGKGKGKKERESQVPVLELELATTQQMFELEKQMMEARLGGNELEVVRLNGLKEQLQFREKIAKIKLDADLPAAEKALQIQRIAKEAELSRLQTNFDLETKILETYKKVQDAIIDIGKKSAMELEDKKEYTKLVMEGVLPSTAKITVEVRRQFAIEAEKLNLLQAQIRDQITSLEVKKNLTKEDQAQRDILLDILRQRLKETSAGMQELPALAGETIQSRIQSEGLNDPTVSMRENIADLEKEFARLSSWQNQAVEGSKAIGAALGEAMTTGVASLVSGTATAQEVFASFLQSVGQALLQAASQMIATYIAIGVARIFAGLGSSGAFNGNASIQGGGLGSFSAGAPSVGGVPNLPGLEGAGALTSVSSVPSYAGVMFANGGIARGGFRAFADGGVVSGPTLGLVGEGRYNEAVVPLPDGKSIPVQMQGDSLRDKMGGGTGGMSMPMLSMSFQSTTINGVEYVDRAQLEAAMMETRKMAVREGATRGATIALDKLANSPSSRRRVGLR